VGYCYYNPKSWRTEDSSRILPAARLPDGNDRRRCHTRRLRKWSVKCIGAVMSPAISLNCAVVISTSEEWANVCMRSHGTPGIDCHSSTSPSRAFVPFVDDINSKVHDIIVSSSYRNQSKMMHVGLCQRFVVPI
jgi:hypothetical protein